MPPKVSGKASKKSGKASESITKSDKKKKKPKRKESYNIFIYKVLKQVHPDNSISSKAMDVYSAICGELSFFGGFWAI